MTFSAVTRKSFSDLTRRRARAVFSVAALAIAVASVGLFALPTLMNRAMNKEIAANKLADVTVTVNPLPLSSRQLQALRSLPNVVAFAPGRTFGTYVYKVSRAIVIGKASFAHQTVDAVTVTAGSAPGPGEVLADVQNAAYAMTSAARAARCACAPATAASSRCRSAARHGTLTAPRRSPARGSRCCTPPPRQSPR